MLLPAVFITSRITHDPTHTQQTAHMRSVQVCAPNHAPRHTNDVPSVNSNPLGILQIPEALVACTSLPVIESPPQAPP